MLSRIAHLQGRRDEAPNLELAQELAERRDHEGIREIAENLWNRDRNIQSDCLKVLYEVGAIDPKLVAPYADDFLRLLESSNNRLVWGSMTALGTIASLAAEKLYEQLDTIKRAIEHGSVITADNGVRVLAGIASRGRPFREEIVPYLLAHLRTCRAKEVPQHAESTLIAIDGAHAPGFIETLEARLPEMPASRIARIRKVIREASKR